MHHLSFAEGDTFGSFVLLSYQGNIMSALGDEGGVGYAAEVAQDVRVFRGTVDTFDPATPSADVRSGEKCRSVNGVSRLKAA